MGPGLKSLNTTVLIPEVSLRTGIRETDLLPFPQSTCFCNQERNSDPSEANKWIGTAFIGVIILPFATVMTFKLLWRVPYQWDSYKTSLGQHLIRVWWFVLNLTSPSVFASWQCLLNVNPHPEIYHILENVNFWSLSKMGQSWDLTTLMPTQKESVPQKMVCKSPIVTSMGIKTKGQTKLARKTKVRVKMVACFYSASQFLKTSLTEES